MARNNETLCFLNPGIKPRRSNSACRNKQTAASNNNMMFLRADLCSMRWKNQVNMSFCGKKM